MDFRKAFSEQYWELIERYRAELLNQAVAILGGVEEAEDIVQETFCDAFRDPDKLQQAQSIGAWLRSINRNKALDRVRARRRDSRKLQLKQQNDPQRELTTGGISAMGVRESVARALETLPAQMRSVVVLRYWENLSYQEIAQRLKLPVGTVGRLRYEATMRLYEKLKSSFDMPQQQNSEE